MNLEVSLSPFDTTWKQLSGAATTADQLGIGGVWIMDHLTGAVHDRSHVLECFSVLGGLAEVTTDCRLGTLVVNCGLRPAALLAQSAATVAHQSGGRFVLGIGAGGGAGTPYAAEMEAAGLGNASARVRRERVEDTLGALEHLWCERAGDYSGTHLHVGDATGFLHPSPPPPLLIGGFGPRMAELAGRHGAAFNTHAQHPDLATLASTAREAAAAVGTPPIEITAFDLFDEAYLDPTSTRHAALDAAGVDTLILVLAPPFPAETLEAIAAT